MNPSNPSEPEERDAKVVEQELVKMRDLVHEVLVQSERARNDDKYLFVRLLRTTGANILEEAGNVTWHFRLDELGQMPNMHTMLRVRRKIQEEEPNLMPTDPEVLYHRRFKEEVIRKVYANKELLLDKYTKIKYGVS